MFPTILRSSLKRPHIVKPSPLNFARGPARSILFATALLVVGLSPAIYAASAGHSTTDGATRDGLARVGVLRVTDAPFLAVGDGVTDDTAAIQAAVHAAYEQQMVCLFPEGTYLVADTISGLAAVPPAGMDEDDSHWWSFNLIGSTKGARPVIKLKSGAAGFDDENHPKPVIHLARFGDDNGNGRWDEGEPDLSSSLYNSGIRGVDIEVGADNPGAAAIRFMGAQQCFLTDIKITLRSGFCGLYEMIGQNSAFGNIEIIGGKYGIYAPETRFPAITGLTLIDQTDYAISNVNGPSLLVTGFRIRKFSAPAIRTATTGQHANNSLWLVDGSIEFTEASDRPAIDNEAGRSIVMKNVYVGNAAKIVASPDEPALTGAAKGWVRVGEYIRPVDQTGLNLIDGSASRGSLVSTSPVDAGEVPADLLSRHLWEERYFPTADDILDRIAAGDASVANVADYGIHPAVSGLQSDLTVGPDVSDALQALIDDPAIHTVFLPKGKFLVGKSITLRGDTVLLGIGTSFTGLATHESFAANLTQYEFGGTAVVATEDSAGAAPKMAFLSLRYRADPSSKDWFQAFHWRAGRNSMLRNLYIRPIGGNRSAGNNKADFTFSGHAGGRHYSLGLGADPGGAHENHLRMLVDGTSEPLHFHNLNVENSPSAYQAVIIDSSNVAIYGAKGEDTPAYLWSHCDNCAFFGYSGKPSIQVENSSNMYFAGWSPDTAGYGVMLRETVAGKTIQLSPTTPLGLYKRGETQFDDIAIGVAPLPKAMDRPKIVMSGLGSQPVLPLSDGEAVPSIGIASGSSLLGLAGKKLEGPGAEALPPGIPLAMMEEATNSDYHNLGLISVEEYGAVGNGTHDDTSAIQAALDAARSQSKVLLFPAGTYLVSDTLECFWPNIHQAGTFRWNTSIIQGSTRVPGNPGVIGRPVIKLQNNTFTGSVNINNPANAKPVFHFAAFHDDNENGVWDAGEKENNGNAFFLDIRNIEIDLGSGNTRALGIRHGGAQSCGIEDVKITATGAFGGIETMAGMASPNGNIEIIGGRVGIWGSGAGGASATAVVLTNQTEYAYYRNSGQTATFTGFYITKASAPAIGMYGPGGANTGDLALVDGIIKFTATNGSPAIENPAGNGLYLHDVYIKNASEIVKSGNRPSVAGGSGWKRVTEYVNPDANNSAPGYNYIGGLNYTEYKTLSSVSEEDVPGDLVSRHCWDRSDFPSPDDIFERIHTDEDDTCVIVTEAGMVAEATEANNSTSTGANNNNTEILQGLIDAGKKFILIPKGKFLLKKSQAGNYGIQLRAGTVLLGVNHNLSELRTHATYWKPTSEVPIITTVDSANADPKMAFLKIGFVHANLSNDWFNAYDWRAGKYSLTRDIFVRPVGSPETETNARADQVFSGNGGGRHFGSVGVGGTTSNDAAPYTNDSGGEGGFRRVRIENTSQPLVIYNSNPEDGHDRPQLEVIDSANVIFYGTKAEDRYGYGFKNSSNCAIIGGAGRAEVQFDNCTNSLAAIIVQKTKTSPFNTPTLYLPGGPNLPINAPLGLYKTGTFDWDAVKIIPAGGGDTTPPDSVTGLSATADNPNHQIELDWDDNSEGDLAGYHVYRASSPGGPYERITGAPATTSAYDDDSAEVQDGATWYYVVRTVDTSDNQSGASAEVSAALDDNVPPDVPTGLVAVPGNAQVTLNWDDSEATDFSGFKIYRSTTSESYGAALTTTTASSYVDEAVSNDTTYYYKVSAVDESSNESDLSAEALATPMEGGQETAAFSPTEDATVYENDPDGPNGSWYKLRVRGSGSSAEAITYLKFTVSGVNTVLSAKLKVKTLSDSAIPFDLDAHTMTDTTWDEDTVTYNSKPTLGSQIATVNVTAAGTWYELDVSDLVTGNGTYSIGLTSGADVFGQHLYSREETEASDRPWLEIVYTGTDGTPPATPTGLAATPGDGQIVLDWNDNSESDLDHYEVFRSTTPSGAYGLAIASPTASSYTDTAVENGTTYYYVVKAIDSSENVSTATTEVSATPADTTPPDAPTGLEATAGDQSVSLNWDDNDEADLVGYLVYRAADGTTFILLNSEPVPSSSYLDEDSLENGITYTYKVKAVDEVPNESGFSTSDTAMPVDATPPPPPTGLALTAGDRQVELEWDDSTAADFAGYKVYRSTTSESGYVQIATLTSPNYLDTGLTNGTTYYYVVAAFDEVPNLSGYSDEESATPEDVTPPVAPTGLSATGGDQMIVLDWDDNGEDDLVDYRVWRSTTSGSGYAAIATVSESLYVDSGLTNGTTYYYVISARDEVPNESGHSTQEVSGIPIDAIPPAAPTGLIATAGDGEVVLDWDDNAEADLAGYQVYRSTTSGSYGSPLATTGSSTYTDASVTNGTTYYYVVTARDEVPNSSAMSTEVSATPQVSQVLTFAPSADAPVYQNDASTNFGSWWKMRVRGTGSSAEALSFLKFTVTGVSGTIQSVKLRVQTLSDSATGFYCTAKAVSDTSWTEGGITYNNMPSPGSALDTVQVTATSTWYEFDVSSHVTGNGTYTIALTSTTNQFGNHFHSRETSEDGDRPYLEIVLVGADTTPPAAPSGLEATAGDTRVTLDWDDNTENDFSHYNVKRSTTSGSGYNTIATPSGSSYVDTGRINGTTYYYVISAVDENSNESANSAQDMATPADTTAPSAPTGLTAIAGDGEVVLNWDDNPEADLTDYQVFRSTTSGSYSAALATPIASTYTDSTVTNGTTYYYVVKARDEVPNASAASAEVTATPSSVLATINFQPGADAPVYEQNPTSNYATWPKLRVRSSGSSAEAMSFLKFTVTGVTGAIQSAKLKVKTLSDSSTGFYCSANAVANTTWTESGITWNNKPTVGATLDTVLVGATNTWYELDVSDHITANGTYTLALTTTTDQWGNHFHSREASNTDDRPYLEITYGNGAVVRVEKGSVSGIGSAAWTQVTLNNTFVSPVVVCTTNYTSSDVPAVVRVRSAAGNKFQVKVQNPSGATLTGLTVQYLVVEEGVYSEGAHGVRMEAKKIVSSATDGYTNGWLGQTISLANSYSNPVVLGQVMTANDAGWSQFWCSNEANRALPPAGGALTVGKHVGEDTDTTRTAETLGVIIIESGNGSMGTLAYQAGVSDDVVRGVGNAPPYVVALTGLSSASNVLVSQCAMEGDGGGWALGYGSSWFSNSNLNLAVDEDQVADSERAHTAEPISYIIFE